LYFLMRGNTCTLRHVNWFGTSLRLRLITIGGSCLCTTRWPRHLLPNFPEWQCHVDTLRLFLDEWYITLHLRVDIKCRHHTEHDWLELWKAGDYSLSVCWTNGCLYMIMIFVNVFLLIMVIWLLCYFFIINLPLQFLYRVVGTCDDREPSFMGADGQQ